MIYVCAQCKIRIQNTSIVGKGSKLFCSITCINTYQFGTIWSMIYDVTDNKLSVCFGAPTHNDWHEFKLGNTYDLAIQKFPAVFPVDKSKIWSYN